MSVTPEGAATTSTAPHPKRWWAMAIVSLAVSIIIMDATIVNVILPVLIQDLDLSISQAEWTNSIYALVFAALLITVGQIRTDQNEIGIAVHDQVRVVAGED